MYESIANITTPYKIKAIGKKQFLNLSFRVGLRFNKLLFIKPASLSFKRDVTHSFFVSVLRTHNITNVRSTKPILSCMLECSDLLLNSKINTFYVIYTYSCLEEKKNQRTNTDNSHLTSKFDNNRSIYKC